MAEINYFDSINRSQAENLIKNLIKFGAESIVVPNQPKGMAIFACPDVEMLNIFKIEREEINV